MNEHPIISDLLPLYVSGALEPGRRPAVEKHLASCAACRADLALWQAAAGEINAMEPSVAAPRDLAERALGRIHQASRRTPAAGSAFGHILQLLRSQMPLVNREIWPASALVIGLGFIAALIAEQSGVIYALAPLIAAACVSLVYGPENDPAYELALATPTSPRQILLARLLLVFGYNLGLVLAATFGLAPLLREALLGPLVLTWLAPMTFLSAAALVLSLWLGAPNAISLTYIAWLGNLLAGPLRSPQAELNLSQQMMGALAAYQTFWQAQGLLLLLAAVLFALAVWLAGRQEKSLLHLA